MLTCKSSDTWSLRWEFTRQKRKFVQSSRRQGTRRRISNDKTCKTRHKTICGARVRAELRERAVILFVHNLSRLLSACSLVTRPVGDLSLNWLSVTAEASITSTDNLKLHSWLQFRVFVYSENISEPQLSPPSKAREKSCFSTAQWMSEPLEWRGDTLKHLQNYRTWSFIAPERT